MSTPFKYSKPPTAIGWQAIGLIFVGMIIGFLIGYTLPKYQTIKNCELSTYLKDGYGVCKLEEKL